MEHIKEYDGGKLEFQIGISITAILVVASCYWAFTALAANATAHRKERDRLYAQCLAAKPEYECYALLHR